MVIKKRKILSLSGQPHVTSPLWQNDFISNRTILVIEDILKDWSDLNICNMETDSLVKLNLKTGVSQVETHQRNFLTKYKIKYFLILFILLSRTMTTVTICPRLNFMWDGDIVKTH